MEPAHPLLNAPVLAAIERAASAHRGRRWVGQGFTSLDDRASHPCGILHGTPFSVFAKLGPAAGAREQFTAELAGLRLLRRAAPVPVPVASGLAETPAGALLLYEALPERRPEARQPRDWRAIGQVLAALHQVRHERFGRDGPGGFFGPLPQDNRPVPANRSAASPPRSAPTARGPRHAGDRRRRPGAPPDRATGPGSARAWPN